MKQPEVKPFLIDLNDRRKRMNSIDWPNRVPRITSKVVQSKAGKLFGARPPYLLFAVVRRYYVLLAERVGLAHFFSWGQ